MLIIRDIFTAKPGQATKLAKLMKKVFAKDPTTRVMTDLVGDYNTVVLEMQAKNLAEYEKELEAYRTGKTSSKIDPDAFNDMKDYTELWYTGRREIYRVTE